MGRLGPLVGVVFSFGDEPFSSLGWYMLLVGVFLSEVNVFVPWLTPCFQ